MISWGRLYSTLAIGDCIHSSWALGHRGSVLINPRDLFQLSGLDLDRTPSSLKKSQRVRLFGSDASSPA
ncbi:MAG: hypothetical protein CBC35_05875 [Planctomycetes bacterium TMED75]|nr:hypothetical protein [Planctomycetaceae bacterium]OUU93341.1 MAG: hypothetical protein CBC35_05875 [Planctomycetes bacterium TMED75]